MKVFHPTHCLKSLTNTKIPTFLFIVSCDPESVYCTSCAEGNGNTIYNKVNYLSNNENILMKFINC